MNKKMKITVAGIGGVGGYISAMLADTYENVTLIARGNRKKSLETEGIRLHSQFNGEKTVRPQKIVEHAGEIKEIQDVVFICVKNYSLEEICRDLQGCVDAHTIVLPVMNGADTGDRTRKFLPKCQVVDAVIYITAFFNEDYSITQIGQYAKIMIGMKMQDPTGQEAVEAAGACMQAAGLDARISRDVEADVWEKYIFNCAYNVLTAYYMEMVETLQASPAKCQEFRTLLEEAYAVAMDKQIRIREGYVDSEYARFMSLDEGSTSSLERDMEAGRNNELETFSGYLVTEAAKRGILVPLSDKMYRELRKRS